MKPHHALFIGIAIGLVAGALLMLYTRTPYPDLTLPPPSQAIIERVAVRDSIAERRAIRQQLLDSIAANPFNRDQNIRIARSLGRNAQLDTLLADPR